MSHPRPNPPEPIPDHLVDAFFDRALDEGSRDRVFRAMLADPSRAEDLARTQRAIGLLREPVDAPDLTDRIMARVHSRRRFLPRRLRRTVTAGRLAVAACLVIGVLGIAVTRRLAPRAFELAPRERPLTAMIDAGRDAASSGARDLAGTFSAVTAQAAPVVELGRRVLEEVETAPPGGSRPVYIAALTPGQLPGVRTLPPRRADSLLVFGGSGSVSAAPLPDPHELNQFAAARFPVASVIRLVGGTWDGPGGRAIPPSDDQIIVPGFPPDRTGAPVSASLVEQVERQSPGGKSPPR